MSNVHYIIVSIRLKKAIRVCNQDFFETAGVLSLYLLFWQRMLLFASPYHLSGISISFQELAQRNIGYFDSQQFLQVSCIQTISPICFDHFHLTTKQPFYSCTAVKVSTDITYKADDHLSANTTCFRVTHSFKQSNFRSVEVL